MIHVSGFVISMNGMEKADKWIVGNVVDVTPMVAQRRFLDLSMFLSTTAFAVGVM